MDTANSPEPGLTSGEDKTEGAAQHEPRAPHQPWQRFAVRSSRKTTGGLMAAVLALGLGFAMMTQVQQNEKAGLHDLSQSELVSLLANVNDQSARLETELGDLRSQKSRLESGGDSAAIADAQKRLDELAVLNGTARVKGSGITVRVTQANQVTAANVLDAVQELRDAGAEAIDVGGQRVVAQTWFGERSGAITVSGTPIPTDFTITAIGDSHTMATAMAIPGGVTDTLSQAGAQVKVSEEKAVTISSVAASK